MLRFFRDIRGSVAAILGLALIPLVVAAGGAIDYSRASQARSGLQAAVDSAVLASGKNITDLTATENQEKASQLIRAVFRPEPGITVTRIAFTQTADMIRIVAEANVPMRFMGFIGKPNLTVTAATEIPLGVRRLEVALVLDNTGSMANLGKMAALKDSAKNLVDSLAGVANPFNSIEIALVPFATQVNVGTAYKDSTWMRFVLFSLESVLNVSKWTWAGCVADRDQPYDTRAPLVTASSATEFPAASCLVSALRPIAPLSADYTSVKTAIDLMNPDGNTNTTIGLAWGMSVLTQGAPLSGSARATSPYVDKAIVFLTDGLNTQNRWTTDPALIDARTKTMCDTIKAARIKIFTIRVIEGNETLLRDCASDPSMYYPVTAASQLSGVFQSISSALMRLRISR